ncbi:MAG TPA: diguanylate cyclase [Terriglobales bacterium]|nr:diguanylate cyclase [Terriglobales bacterium]
MSILLVEDSPIDARMIGTYLNEWGLDFISVASGTAAWDALQSPDGPRLVLLDWVLPGIDGIELCRRIRTLGSNGTYIYAVMLTAKDQKRDLLTAMAAGADDYLAKPVDPSELRARVLAGKRIIDLQQSLRFAATHDFLTQILNRAEILAALKRELSRSKRDSKPAAVILADVDHFKRINDCLGHAAGDEVLKEVARRLKSELRPYDLVGRYGGEEFLVILPNCNLITAIRRADEIRFLVSRDVILTPLAKIPVTMSMGITVAHSGFDNLEDLLQQADVALYRAKQNGRNCVEALAEAESGQRAAAP